MEKFSLALACLLACGAAWAQQRVLVEKSEIRFAGKQMNVPTEGRFRKFTAELYLDPKAPEASRAQISIDLASVDLGSEEADTEVKRRPWLDVAAHPQAKFVSTSMKALGGARYQMAGKVTIKATTRDVVVPFTLKREASGFATVEGSFELKRLDYKVGEGPWEDIETVANDVQVRFRLAISGMPR